MKKIISILTNGFEPDVRVYKECKYLVDIGFEVTLLCWDRNAGSSHPSEEICEGIFIKRFKIISEFGTGFKQLPAYIKFLRACKKHIRNTHCDYLYCNDLDGAIIGYFSKLKNIEMIFDMHEFYEKGNVIQRHATRAIVKFLIKNSKAALYENSVYLEDSYASVRNKLYPLRNYPDEQMIQMLPKTESPVFRIGYHGVVRGQIPEFKALFEAVKDLENVRVDINGGGMDLKELRELEKQYSNVYIHGAYNGIKESSNLYANTDVLFCAYPPDDPNYQGDAEVIKYYEAIITGTPMIMTEGIGMASKVVNNGYGLICNTRDSKSIQETINRYMFDKQLWEKCHDNELKDSSKHRWSNAVKVLKEIYI